MIKVLRTAAVWALAVFAPAAALAEWEPAGPIRLMIGFTAGGGVDTQGRLLAEGLAELKGWTIIPENISGRGGAVMATALTREPADGLTIGMTVDGTLGYTVVATDNPGYALGDFTYLSSITRSQMGLVAKASRGWEDIGDVIEAMRGGQQIRVGVMSSRLADGLYLLGEANDVEFTPVMLRGGRAGLNGIIADDIDIAFVAGAQTPRVQSGELVNLVSMMRSPLLATPDAPLGRDYGMPYDLSVLFLLLAPAGLKQAVVDTINAAISVVGHFEI